MKRYYAEKVKVIEPTVGETFALESLREAVRPPYLMLLPFIETPPGVEVMEQRALEGEGVHGSTFVLRVTQPVDGVLGVGFRDLRSGETVRETMIRIVAMGDRSADNGVR